MTPYAFRYGPRIVAGEGAAVRIGGLCPPGPVLVITDRELMALGLVNPLLAALRSEGREVVLSNALILLHVMGFNLPAALRCLSAAAGLPERLREVGIDASDLPRLADDAMRQDRLLRNNPRPIARDDAHRLYEAAL